MEEKSNPIATEKRLEDIDNTPPRKWSIRNSDAEALDHLRTVEVGLATEQVKDTIELDAAEQKRILRKVDWHLIPLLTFLYL